MGKWPSSLTPNERPTVAPSAGELMATVGLELPPALAVSSPPPQAAASRAMGSTAPSTRARRRRRDRGEGGGGVGVCMPCVPPRTASGFSPPQIRGRLSTGIGGVWNASDEALLAGFATGDPDAAGAFVRRFQHRVIGLATLITHDATDAEEVAQDAFVRAWRYAASYDPRRGSVPSWLLGIARNVAGDRVRAAGRRGEPAVEDFPTDRWLEQLPDTVEAIADRDAAAPVLTAMRALPVEQ